jgi:hypothetical protein
MPESNSSHRELTAALRERIAIIGDRSWYQRDPAGHLDQLKAVSERIAAIASTLPAPVDPQLAHFLERCSYDKALAFLENK